MKITEAQLRQIIREETEELEDDDYKYTMSWEQEQIERERGNIPYPDGTYIHDIPGYNPATGEFLDYNDAIKKMREMSDQVSTMTEELETYVGWTAVADDPIYGKLMKALSKLSKGFDKAVDILS